MCVMRQRGWQDQGMEDEEGIDPVTQPREVDRSSAGSISPDESDVDNVSETSAGLEDPPVDLAEPLNPA